MVLYWFIPINDTFFMGFEIIGINSFFILIFFHRMGSGESQMLKSLQNWTWWVFVNL
jgi:hypothetical protein